MTTDAAKLDRIIIGHVRGNLGVKESIDEKFKLIQLKQFMVWSHYEKKIKRPHIVKEDTKVLNGHCREGKK